MKAIVNFIREWMRFFPKAVLVLAITVITGLVIVAASAFIPGEKMTGNIIRSTELLVSEGNWTFVDPAQPTTRIDNFTDSLLLQIAWMPSEEPAESGLAGAMKRGVYNGYYYCHGENVAAVGTLKMLCEGRYDECVGEYYARYWLGGVALLRVLLCFVSYREIRIFMGAAACLLSVAVIFLILFSSPKGSSVKRNSLDRITENMPLVFSLIVSAIFVNPAVWPRSMQLTIVWLIYAVFSVIRLSGKKEKSPEFYMLLGAVLSYFDFLTYPLVPLGLILLMDLWYRRKNSALENFSLIIGHSAYWCFGYFGNWAGKWILACIILKRNLILEGLRDTRVRISLHSGGLNYSLTDVYKRNIYYLFEKRIIIPFLIMLALFICISVIFRNNNDPGVFSMNASNILNIIFIAVCYPVIWYTVLSNHSWEHDWITYRELSIFVFGLMICAAGVIRMILGRRASEKKIEQ